MKTLTFQFIAWARCFTEVEVPDDYELLGDDPYEIWEDLQENFPDESWPDIMDDDYGTLEIDQMSLEYIDSVCIENDQGEEISFKKFEKVLFNR